MYRMKFGVSTSMTCWVVVDELDVLELVVDVVEEDVVLDEVVLEEEVVCPT